MYIGKAKEKIGPKICAVQVTRSNNFLSFMYTSWKKCVSILPSEIEVLSKFLFTLLPYIFML